MMDSEMRMEEKKCKGKVTILFQGEKAAWENYIWNCKNKVVYGPVLSRRLGRSLGINLFPSESKVCTFNCIYCDCGSVRKKVYAPISPKEIKNKLARAFRQYSLWNTAIDYITFAGNGEPTYYPHFAQIVASVLGLRDEYFPKKPLAIFSNGTMVFKNEVVESIAKIEERIFKLDGGDEKAFGSINRPNIGFSLERIIDGLTRLKDIKISSAVIISDVGNYDSLKNHSYIRALKKIKPLEVHLYSIDYPPAQRGVRRARVSRMVELAEYIAANMDIEIKVLRARKSWYEVRR